MKHKVNVLKTEEGYAVWVHGLPSCWSQGKTEQEGWEDIKDALQPGNCRTTENGQRIQIADWTF